MEGRLWDDYGMMRVGRVTGRGRTASDAGRGRSHVTATGTVAGRVWEGTASGTGIGEVVER